MVYTNESNKAKAIWQTLRLYSTSYDGLIFLLSILRYDYWLYFGFSPGPFYFLLACGSSLLAWIWNRILGQRWLWFSTRLNMR